MKILLLILTLAGLGYIGYQTKEHFGEPLKEALNIEDSPSAEASRASYQTKLAQLQKQVFGPLGESRRPIQLEPLLRQVREDLHAKMISKNDEARIRRRINALQPALQERNRFVTEYGSIATSGKRSFDQGVKDRRSKLQKQDIERRWAEASKRLEAAYERTRSTW